MITSAQSGFFDETTTWTGGAVPGASDAWAVSEGHTVTIRDSRTQSGQADVFGNLVIGDIGQTNCGAVLGSLLMNHYHGSIRVRNGCFLGLPDGVIFVNSGDLFVEGGIGLAPGASAGQLWLMNLDGAYGDQPPRTISILNPHAIRLRGVANGLAWLGGSSPDMLPPDRVVLRLTYTSAPAIAPASAETIDLNTVAPGNSVEDFGFAWDWTIDQWLPHVWAVVDGAVLPVEIAVQWISDNQWRWTFTLPGDAALGARLLVTTAHGDDPDHWRVQQLRGQVAGPWATVEQVGRPQDGTSPATGLYAAVGAARLAADGLDAVSIAGPTGPAGNFREMLVQLWRRFFKKATVTATQLKTYADDGATVVTTQAVSDDGATQTQGTAG